MRSRRTHTKSRLGCVQCKHRRIKCDERTPSCNNCLRHEIDCIYSMSPVKSRLLAQNDPAQRISLGSSSMDLINTAETVTLTSSPSPAMIVSPEPDPLNKLDLQRDGHLPGDLHLRDLELMHHYSTVSYRTISCHDKFSASFQNEVPKIALSHPFLMHGLLALSASHLAYLNKGSERAKGYDELAAGHQTLALTLFRKALDNITPSNSEALFAFSSIAAVLAFASPQTTGVHSLSPIDEMLQVVNLCRGVSQILQTSTQWLKTANSWVPNVLASIRTVETQPIPADVDEKLSLLFKLNTDLTVTGQTIEETAVCEHALSELSLSFEQIHSGFDPISVFRWPITVKPAFISSLRERRPMSLVALAHFCILLHMMNDFWWIKEWPRQLLQSIHTLFDPYWRDIIRWPMEVVGVTS
ncbi:putative C6 transcription factor [Talaromyces proteolyticus]|uniref:C6 transcription factor n=1 Tax=Talaromyces proteolyticus TaxID=1131652 RepID=A0AAD4KQ70_9EURO|nr:putative C6 transcription factor [Talaromyces proteolyticus]KAH8696715.1 putative C6 transcription factor [Talaromyces proteolyticus]